MNFHSLDMLHIHTLKSRHTVFWPLFQAQIINHQSESFHLGLLSPLYLYYNISGEKVIEFIISPTHPLFLFPAKLQYSYSVLSNHFFYIRALCTETATVSSAVIYSVLLIKSSFKDCESHKKQNKKMMAAELLSL